MVLAWARARQAGEVGAAAPPTDVDTTGSSPEHDPQAATTAPDDWRQNPYVQLEGGFLAGVSLGLVPMGGVGQQLADAGEVLPHGTPEARLGLAVGQIVGGIALTVGGFTGEVLGGAATVTGIGVAVGVPAMVVSTTLVVGGAGNIAAGIRGLMTTGSGSTGPQGTVPAPSRGPLTAGKNFKEHFVNHRAAVEKALGVKVGKLKEGGGEALLKALGDGIDNGTFKYVGQGTLKKGAEAMNIYRGNGLTVVTKTNREWVTAITTGEGLDLGIQMLP